MIDRRLSRRLAALSWAGLSGAALALGAFLTGCGSGEVKPAGEAARLLNRPAPEDTTLEFVGGGAPGELLLRRGARHARLDFGNERLLVTPEGESFAFLAAWRDPKSGVARRLARGAERPLLVENDQAYELPRWPAGAVAVAGAFSPDGRRLAVGLSGPDLPGAVALWSLPLAAPRYLGARGASAARQLAWSADGRSLLLVDASNTLSLFRPPKAKAVYVKRYDPSSEGRISAVDISPDGDWFVVAANAVTVRAWQLPFMNAPLTPWGRVKTVFFAGEVGSIITVDETNTAIRWSVNYGNVRPAVTAHLTGMDLIQAPVAGQFFAGVDSAGVLHAWRSGDLKPLESSLGDAPFRP